MSRWQRILVSLCAGAGLAACAGSRAADQLDARSAAPDAAGLSGPPGLGGVLRGPDGAPVAGAKVAACTATFCLYDETRADGSFRFDVDPPVAIALKTHEDLARTPRWASVLVPIDLHDPQRVDLGACFVPDLPLGAHVGPASADPQTLDAGDGLTLTVRRADLAPPFGDVLDDVAARMLPAAHVPVYPALAGEQVLAVYALHPFTGKSASPMAVRLPTTLPDGATAHLRTIDELDGTFSAPIVAHASGGVLASDPGTGITRLTYLVVSR